MHGSLVAQSARVHLAYTHIRAYIHTYIQVILLPLSGHTHLAEPGCLFTTSKLARNLQEDKLPSKSSLVAWATKDPPGPLLLSKKEPQFAPQLTPGTQTKPVGASEVSVVRSTSHPPSGVVGGRKSMKNGRSMCICQGPTVMSVRHKPLTTSHMH